ncbi:hypothetical protein C9374_008213 [Naegleria lovaniensis]|uniref:F-box domain-containing protein n=1 Tax=Naegleria lovaniensis TaxID=51637 RepID=A0AA88GJC7_NAELO|nr:uncharacterized protein C9374_008213 [Naegleria lovaniensis]KAG2378574.1 hypothetical protein C9374_008213 [Naegleria lovaniensis]
MTERALAHAPIYNWDDSSSTTHKPSFLERIAEQGTEPKFWRRQNILVPGTTIKISSEVKTVNLLSSEQVKSILDEERKKKEAYKQKMEEEGSYYDSDYCDYDDDEEAQTDSDGEKPTEEVENHDRCIYIGSLLSSKECTDLIEATSQLGYQSIENEYPKEYRNSERVLVLSKKLADILWQRIQPFLTAEDFKDVRPYGFDNAGTWKPIGINECLRFNRYKQNAFFKPHQDAKFIRNDNEQSIFTILVYLDSSYAGTTLLKKVPDPQEKDVSIMKFKKITTLRPKEGAVAIFNHDLYHAGQRVRYGRKYVLRTELIFKRVDSESIFRMNYKHDEEYLRIKKLVDESNELEKQGKVLESSQKYLEAHELHTSISHSLQRKKTRNSSFIETVLPEEIFAAIFSYLPIEDVVKNVLYLNRDINSYARSPSLWKRFYALKWAPIVKSCCVAKRSQYTYYFSDSDPSECLQDVYSKENELIEALEADFRENDQDKYKDWYHAFISRANMEKFFCPVLLDLGVSHYRYGLSKDTCFWTSRTSAGKPDHPHFYLNQYGFDDFVVGERYLATAYHCERLNILTSTGEIEDSNLLKILIYQMYKDDLNINLKEHPLVICTPMSWSDSDKDRIKSDVFSLGIPGICFVDQSKMLSLFYQTPTFFRINVGPSGVRCVSVIDGQPQNNNSVFHYPPVQEKYMQLAEKFYYYDNRGYYWPTKFTELALVAPVDKARNPKQYDEFVREHQSYNIGSYYSPKEISPRERAALGDWYYEEIMSCVKKAISTIQTCEDYSKQERDQVLSNVMITGGGAMIHGMAERLEAGITELLPHYNIHFTIQEKAMFPSDDEKENQARSGPSDMNIIGGAKIFSNLSNFRQQCEMNPAYNSETMSF